MAYTIGKYRLLAKIGKGGMANVFLALSQGPVGFSKLVVIKRMHRILSEDDRVAAMFRDEARLAARLSHPNVVSTFEVGEDDGVYYLAMEYLDGQHFGRVLTATKRSPGSFEPVHLLHIIANTLDGLHYAHELCDYDGTPFNVVHRDINPQNIFITYEGQVKLVDFGVAKAKFNENQTVMGGLKGKVGFMAPEQLQGKPVDRRTDIFSTGVVMWEALTMERLFPGDVVSTLHKLVSEPVPKVSSVSPNIPPRLEAIVERALQKDPTDRYQTAEQMRADIVDYINSCGKPVTQSAIAERFREVFAIDRERMRQRIEETLQGVSSADGQQNQPVAAGQSPTVPVIGSEGAPATREFTPTGASAPLAPAMGAPEPTTPSGLTPISVPSFTGTSGAPSLPPGGTVPGWPVNMSPRRQWLIAAGVPVLILTVGLLLGRFLLVSNPPSVPVAGTDSGHAKQPAAQAPSESYTETPVYITSTPAGATVSWNGASIGQTPMQHWVPPGQHQFTLSKDGHQDTRIVVRAVRGNQDLLEAHADLPVIKTREITKKVPVVKYIYRKVRVPTPMPPPEKKTTPAVQANPAPTQPRASPKAAADSQTSRRSSKKKTRSGSSKTRQANDIEVVAIPIVDDSPTSGPKIEAVDNDESSRGGQINIEIVDPSPENAGSNIAVVE